MSDDDKPELPTNLVKPGPPQLSKFGPLAVDNAINRKLQDLIPAHADTAILDVHLKSEGEQRVLQGLVAARIGDKWGLAVGGGVDLHDRRNYEVEIVASGAW